VEGAETHEENSTHWNLESTTVEDKMTPGTSLPFIFHKLPASITQAH
jgi:hypothetical protein